MVSEEMWLELLDSHLCAGKCAIDLGFHSKASEELHLAKSRLEASEQSYPAVEAYLTLYFAELETQWGSEPEALRLFAAALQQFQALEIPDVLGLVEAKIGLVQFALKSQKFELAFEQIGELMALAEQAGCMVARTRLLAFETQLCLYRDAPQSVIEGAYHDILRRGHLMNNPRLTFEAFANIYSYARESLDKRDQKFWLQRIRGLRSVLEKSCFEQLYRTHVLNRYRQSIEGELDRFDDELDLGWESSDSE